MWNALNRAMANHGVPNPNFKGFMDDSAQENYRVVRLIYGNGDPKIPMEDRERTCFFHYTMSLDRHTHRLARSDMQNQHKMLCKQHKDVKHVEESEVKYLAI